MSCNYKLLFIYQLKGNNESLQCVPCLNREHTVLWSLLDVEEMLCVEHMLMGFHMLSGLMLDEDRRAESVLKPFLIFLLPNRALLANLVREDKEVRR